MVAEMTSLRVPAFAKVNLGLEVLGLREDGYHELRTIFQSIDLHDDIEITSARRDVTVTCDHPGVPTDGRNLAVKAALLLRRARRVARGVRIHITKRIPVAGGLGGGSSDAASVLLALDRLWDLGLGPSGLHPVARRLGADVPFFLHGGTALGLARGEEVYPLHRQVKAHVVVVDPGHPVSTAAVFRRVDAHLTPRANSRTIFRFLSSDLEGGQNAFPILSNELELAALAEAPELAEQARRIRSILKREGALVALLSGSGSSYFGLFDERERARQAHSALIDRGFRAFIGRTLSLDQYRRRWARSLEAGHARGSDQGRSGQHGDHRRQGHPGGGREAQGVRIDRV